jgi:tetratricopeptide (TPR) repeat protein
LENGEPPLEPALDATRATGRWLLFLSEYLTQGEMLRRALSGAEPEKGLASSSGMMFLQMGVALEPNADDWRLYAASALLGSGGVDGAERVIDRTPADSVFAADADIVRAQIAIDRNDDAAAVAAAERALASAGNRWSVIASAGDIYRSIGRSEEAVSAFNRALALTEDGKDRARILGWRAFAHRYAGDQSAATADARAALAADQSVNTRLLYVSILMDDARAWSDGIRVARELFAEQPDSVMRLNALGYALIQRPEGLEEGYRLLWRGFSFGQTDYAVIDSLGWAYYLHGAYDEARALIERANDLAVGDPNAEVLDHLGDVYWRLGRRDDARQAWREGLDARPDALRLRSLERKLSRGLTEPAPRRRDLPNVSLPSGPSERGDL